MNVSDNARALIEEYERRKRESPQWGLEIADMREIVKETNNMREDLYLKYAFMAGYKAAIRAASRRVNDLLGNHKRR